MNFTIIALALIVGVAILIIKLSPKSGSHPAEYPYRKLEFLFTPAERSFLGVLTQAVEDHVQILGKVRVADVIATQKGLSQSERRKSFNKISSKHFDFLLCSKDDLSVLCAIELNDSSHKTKKRKDRDAFLEGACQSAKLPLIQISAKATYNISEIKHSLASYLPENHPKHQPQDYAEKVIENTPQDIERLCPKCSSKMNIKVAKKGKTIGDEFWACSAFPKCRHIEAITV